MSHAALLRESLAPLVDLVFPPRCPVCAAAIGEQAGLCASCWSELLIPAQPACRLCQAPMREEPADASRVCAPCLLSPPDHAGIAAATLYNDPSRSLVLALKHGGRIALAPFMAGMMAARLPRCDEDAVLVPVPLHRWRLWRRGYNQSALLAQALGRRVDRPVLVDALVRHRQTPVLGGLGRQQREKVLSGAIGVRPNGRVMLAGRQVVLVDDVLTSGATSNACVRALLKAGARSVVVCCFARVVEDEPLASLPAASETPGI